jgi:hypothetical protein
VVRIIEGLLQRLDPDRGQVGISGQTLAMRLDIPSGADVMPGTWVAAFMVERDGILRVIHLQAARQELGVP